MESQTQYRSGQIVPFETPSRSCRVLQEFESFDGLLWQLIEFGAGARLAGSVLTWADPCYSVQARIDGCLHGSSYSSLADAEMHFDKIMQRG